jgi:FAD/FMN-containing dehydrogenase
MTKPYDRPGRRAVMAGLAAAPAFMATSAFAMANTTRPRPGGPGWPSAEDWDSLKVAVGGRLDPVTLPNLTPAEAHADFANQFWLGDQAALTQAWGWADAWRSEPSAYVVKAAGAADVAAAVKFARAHRLRVVVKGGGHSYLGGSSAPDSLLIWTRNLDSITVHDAFTPQGMKTPPVPAVSVGAGCVWLWPYQEVTGAHGRYVQGGGCTTVGVAGHVQGGGFGSFSKAFGLAAASLVEAEIITADGRVRIVNAAQDPDLFWALKGGGGGTFGVVTRLTLKTHDLPATFGAANWKVKAASDSAYQALLARFIDAYAAGMNNPHWGEQARARRDNILEISMVFQGLDAAAARAPWTDLLAFVTAHPDDYKAVSPFVALPIPAKMFWNPAFLDRYAPGAITRDNRPDARAGDYVWTGDAGQAWQMIHAYASAWLPARLLETPDGRARLTQAWFDSSRHWGMAFHFNKGLAGADAVTLDASRDTAMNPQVLTAFALAITAADGAAPLPGHAPADLAQARVEAVHVTDAINALRTCAPDAGSYMSECDYHLADWAQAQWGENASRLARIKRRYDPDGLFFVRHGVGSEGWSADGFQKV